MLLRVWRFLTLMFTALSMAMAFSHLLQMRPRMSYDAVLWRATQTMYQLYGPPIGAIIETGAWISALVLLYLVRNRRPAFRWTMLGAACFLVAQIAWWIYIFPVNKVMVDWTAQSMPPNWTEFRFQWESTHAVRAILQIAGFAALVLSILGETPVRKDLYH